MLLLSIDFNGFLMATSIISWSTFSSNSSTFGNLLSSTLVLDNVVTRRVRVGLFLNNFDLPDWYLKKNIYLLYFTGRFILIISIIEKTILAQCSNRYLTLFNQNGYIQAWKKERPLCVGKISLDSQVPTFR